MSALPQIRAGALIFGGIIAGIVGLWFGRFLPGTAGELMARIFHIITTPIILEISFGVLGLLIVLALAHYHEKRADEWVEMDIPDEPKDR
jgi:hypothetical protein